MSRSLEWVHATSKPTLLNPDDLSEVDVDGNPDKDWGLDTGGDSGAMIYGHLSDIEDWIGRAQAQVERVKREEQS